MGMPGNFPPEKEGEVDAWMEEYGNWNSTVKRDLVNLITELQNEDDDPWYSFYLKIGIFGMGWGGKIATLAASEDLGLYAAALVHPAFVSNDEADGVEIPMYLFPSKDEPDMIPFYNVLKQKFLSKCGHRRFTGMKHGFAGARGNFSDPVNALAVYDMIIDLSFFFRSAL